ETDDTRPRTRGRLRNGKTDCAHFELPVVASSFRSTRAGLPITMTSGGTSRVTTLPAPTMARSPIVTLDKIVAPDPIEAPFLTSVFSTAQSSPVWSSPAGVVARGNVSFTNATLWLEILQRRPIYAFF